MIPAAPPCSSRLHRRSARADRGLWATAIEVSTASTARTAEIAAKIGAPLAKTLRPNA